MQEKLLFRGGLCVAWHDQPSSVSSWKRNVKHLHGSKRLQHCPGRQSGSQRLQPVFQRHQQTVSEERHQDVCFHAMAELMINRTQAQFALQGLESGLDLGELDVTFPEHARIFPGQIRAQQIMTITQFRLAEFLLVDGEGECFASDRFIGFRYPDRDESEGPPGFFFGSADAQQ